MRPSGSICLFCRAIQTSGDSAFGHRAVICCCRHAFRYAREKRPDYAIIVALTVNLAAGFL